MPKRLHPWPIRRRAATFPASTPRNRCAGMLRIGGDLFREPRLADSGLSDKAKELTASPRDAGQARAQFAQLTLASDKYSRLSGTLRAWRQRRIYFAARHAVTSTPLNSLAQYPRRPVHGH